jgi:ABC-type branched-subunit amino acid transport system ATPase component
MAQIKPANRSAANLVVEDVIKLFSGLRALDSVSLEINPGEILGLIGPNGSGKTTLINVVTGFLKPENGRIEIDGTDITGWQPHKIAPLGLARTFQTIRLFSNLTVLENVEVAAVSIQGGSRREATRLAYEILERFGMKKRADMRASQLAYGDMRRVEIARALATNPKYLLLDEPAAGLNEVEGEELLKTLLTISRDFDLGMMVVDHEMRLIMQLCDRLHVLNYGKSIGEGTPKEIRDNPAVIDAYLGPSKEEYGRVNS